MRRIILRVAGVIVALAVLVLLVLAVVRLVQPGGEIWGFQIPLGRRAALPQARIVFSEMVRDTTTIWSAPVDKLDQRQQIARIAHEAGYGIRASLSPDGSTMACAVLPPGKKDTNTSADLWLLDIGNSKTQLLVDGIDLSPIPLWSPDGKRILFRRTQQLADGSAESEIFDIDIATARQRRLLSDNQSLGLYPCGWSADGTVVYYSKVSAKGTYFASVDATTGTKRDIAHVSSGIARGFHVSPDGRRAVYTVPAAEVKGRYQIGILDVKTGSKEVLVAGTDYYISPIWRPDGTITYGSEPGDAFAEGGTLILSIDKMVAVPLTSTPETGFDAPFLWSQDGKNLAVHHFEGSSSQEVTSRSLVVISEDKKRHQIEGDGYLEFIGWLEK